MKPVTLSAIAFTLILTACAAPDGGTVTRLDAAPALTGGTYSTGGGLTLASTYRPVDGRTALCGAWAESKAQTPYTKGKARDILSGGAAYLDGEKILDDLGYFRKIQPTTDYRDIPATCRVTAQPWRPDYANRVPDIRLPRQVVYYDPSGISGPRISFQQTGPGALGGSLDLVQALFSDRIRLPLGQTPVRGGGRYSSGGGVDVAVELRQIGNTAYACGVWSESRRQTPRTEQQAPEVLARGRILADGREVLSDLRFLRRTRPGGPYGGRLAHCVDTGRPWAEVSRARITASFPRITIYPGPGKPVIFTPKG